MTTSPATAKSLQYMADHSATPDSFEYLAIFKRLVIVGGECDLALAEEYVLLPLIAGRDRDKRDETAEVIASLGTSNHARKPAPAFPTYLLYELNRRRPTFSAIGEPILTANTPEELGTAMIAYGQANDNLAAKIMFWAPMKGVIFYDPSEIEFRDSTRELELQAASSDYLQLTGHEEGRIQEGYKKAKENVPGLTAWSHMFSLVDEAFKTPQFAAQAFTEPESEIGKLEAIVRRGGA